MPSTLSRTILVLLGFVGLVALALAAFSVLDGDWVPLAIVLPGMALFVALILRR